MQCGSYQIVRELNERKTLDSLTRPIRLPYPNAFPNHLGLLDENPSLLRYHGLDAAVQRRIRRN